MALIGDREREQAVALLRDHYLRGRLTVEELSERLEVAMTARRDGEARVALADLPGGWSQRGGAAPVLDAVWRGARRAAFVVAVWALWWAASLALLIGFVASVALQGLSLTNAVAFPAVWLACTIGARRVTRSTRG